LNESGPQDNLLIDEFRRWNALLDHKETEQEAPPSQPLALQGSWEVREHYSIEDGVLIGRGEVQSIYFPASRPELLQDFQRLRDKSAGSEIESAILSFARRWGGLGYSELQDETAEPDSEDYGLFRPTRDPINWLISHAVSVWGAAKTLGLAREGSFLDSLAPEAYIPNPFVFAARERLLEWDYVKDPPMTLAGTTNVLLSIAERMVMRNISGIHIDSRVDFDSKKLGSMLSFTSLIEVIWWHVLNLGGSSIIKNCPECGSVFPATRANQVYCPIPFYSSGTVSPCSSRLRMRVHREASQTEVKP
jgi:hypothetical protein